ncbi:MAG: hypothetical protein KIT09_28490 [Bryobacteraceae bacterium]|nr:hypothetical protein [Bryobacteraceae bacterium]
MPKPERLRRRGSNTQAVRIGLVHHANQYLITDGYENRESLSDVIGAPGQTRGLLHVLELHRRYGIPFNLHISGTLLEAIAWHQPSFLVLLRKLLETGLMELVGSCYGQNIMRFFGPDYNRKQLNEELRLYGQHLRVDPQSVAAFWPPERVWDTRRMTPALRDAKLLNGGYRYVIIDDRLLLPKKCPELPRGEYDQTDRWTSDLYRMWEIEDGLGLIAFPIGKRLRRSIPPKDDDDWMEVRGELEALLVDAQGRAGALAIYADDMEKVAGIGEWGGAGPGRYERFLEWLAGCSWIEAARLTEWARTAEVAGTRKIETGTFEELATEFQAGEGYERWYLAPDWAPYRGHFTWAEGRVKELASRGADEALMELAEKQLLVSNWETAWHTPPSGPHGDPESNGHASPWARALTSHSRHAAVTAEAACWMKHRDGLAHAVQMDIDNDGETEIVLKNDHLFAVVTSRWGARIVSLYRIGGDRGAMVVGNPCDDWNWMEELNKFMEAPRNHPGAFADAGFENDEYEVERLATDGDAASVILRNAQPDSGARGLRKEFVLSARETSLLARYELPETPPRIKVEFGLSPDYLQLLRSGSAGVAPVRRRGARGLAGRGATVWITPGSAGLRWSRPAQEKFGHGITLCISGDKRRFDIAIGAELRSGVQAIRGEVSPRALVSEVA